MKILVTGATGFIGRHVINELLKKDCDIIVATKTNNKLFSSSKIQHVSFDLDKIDTTKNYFIELGLPDLLIHLAWQGLPNYKSDFHLNHNLPMHSEFLKNIIENGLNDLTVTGTCLECGKKEGCLSEDMEGNPTTSYAIAKDNLRKFLFSFQKKNSFHLKWVRLFYMYGKGQNPNSLLSQLQSALDKGDAVFNMSSGEQERDYLPVEKVAQYIVDIAMQNKIDGVINCCSGQPIKVKQFVENYLKEKNQNIKLNPGYYPYPDYEAMSFWGDDRKLKKVIN